MVFVNCAIKGVLKVYEFEVFLINQKVFNKSHLMNSECLINKNACI